MIIKTLFAIVAGACFCCQIMAQDFDINKNTFLEINGVPTVFGNGHDRWALIVVNQVYDAKSERPVELKTDGNRENTSIVLIHSNENKTNRGSELSYNLKIYRVDFLRSRSLVLKMRDFNGLPADYR